MDAPKILAPVCSTDNSANGLKYAISLAKAKNSELDIFHVLESDEKQNKIPHSDIFIKELGASSNHKEIIRKGETHEEIIKIALELEPELIVMSPNSLKKERKFFEESDTGKVLKASNYPILMIPSVAKFSGIKNIVLGTNMKENTIESIHGILKIFRKFNPHINILVFSDKVPSWHFREDVFNMIENVKHYTEYLNITGNICDHNDPCVGLEICVEKINADIVCMESNVDIFYNFFNCKTDNQIPYLLNKPILVLSRHWEDIIKKA